MAVLVRLLLLSIGIGALPGRAEEDSGWDPDDYYCVIGRFAVFSAILGVPDDAEDTAIRRAYRKLSLKYHPDKPTGDQEMFTKVSRAYEVLSDSNKRRLYDTGGEDALKDADRPQGHDPFAEIFGSFFGGGGRQGGRKKKDDIEVVLFVSLGDIYNGKTLKVTHYKQRLCRKCRGTGAHSKKDIHKCDACDGKGFTVRLHQMAPGMYQQVQAPCQRCGGTGKVVGRKCKFCKGKRIVSGHMKHDVVIEKGMPDGHHIKFEHAGDESPDSAPGDLLFKVETSPHPTFTRKGHDLHMDVTITLKEALLGFVKILYHLDSREVEVSREGVVTQPGFVHRIAGEGMPHHDMPSQFGDLYVKYTVEMPSEIDPELREKLDRIL